MLIINRKNQLIIKSMETKKGFLAFFFFAIIFQSTVSMSILSVFRELLVLDDLNAYNLGNAEEDYPRYFQALNGLLGMNALSILTAFYGSILLYKSNKKSIYSFITL